MKKKIIFCDLDGVVADFDADSHLLLERDPLGLESKTPKDYFLNLKVINGALEALTKLSKHYEIYFLSTPQWNNPFCWMEKRQWVEKHFGELMFKRLILTHNKELLRGDYLIDDRTTNGVDKFDGEHIHFSTKEFPNWDIVVKYLMFKYEKDTN